MNALRTNDTTKGSAMQLRPYLFFNGRCEEALHFYRDTLGAEITALMRYKESPMPPPNMQPGMEDRIMHAEFRIGESFAMASDGCDDVPPFAGFSLSIEARDADDAEQLFNAMVKGGKVEMPMSETFFSPRFGMLTDRFGVGWMVGYFPPA